MPTGRIVPSSMPAADSAFEILDRAGAMGLMLGAELAVPEATVGIVSLSPTFHLFLFPNRLPPCIQILGAISALLVGNARDADSCNKNPLVRLFLILVGLVLIPSVNLLISPLFHH